MPRVTAVFVALTALSGVAHASQDELPALLTDPDRWIAGEADEGAILFPATHGQVDFGVYPTYPDLAAHHFWHGRVLTDIGLVRKNDRWAVHASLAMQLVADPENVIAFRPNRMYFEVYGAFEHRLGPGVIELGYHHRCSHLLDRAVPGRILIRSGPEVAYASDRQLGPAALSGRGFVTVLLAGQYADGFKPRGLAGGTVQLTVGQGRVRGIAAAGTALALVGDQGEDSYYLGTPIGEAHVEVLPTASVAVELEGQAATLRVVAQVQRLLDSGHGQTQDPTWVASIGPGFWW